jgi:hypothetical protein
MASDALRAVLAYTGPADTAAVEQAASEEGLRVVLAPTLSELLRRLGSDRWTVTVLSLAAPHVDADVVELIWAGSGTRARTFRSPSSGSPTAGPSRP